VVVPSGVLIVCHMAKDPVDRGSGFVLTSPVDHSFLFMVISSLLDRG
jgi:hypothetical protein